MNGTPRTSLVLWAVALFGLFLYLDHQPGSPSHHGGSTAKPVAPSTIGQMVSGVLPAIVHFLLWALALALVVALVITAYRYYMRLRRVQAMRVEEIILGPDDTATPYEVMSALDAIHGQMLTRYAGGAMGQNSFAFEIVRKAEGDIHFLLAAPFEWLHAVEDIWRSKYTNVRFEPWKDHKRPWPFAQQIGLTKHWRHATETQKDYQNSVIESMVQALDRADGGVRFQYLLTPIPSEAVHSELRNHIRSIEYKARAEQTTDPAAPGVGYAESQVVKDALQLYGKSSFKVEMRLAADTWDGIQRVFGALKEADGENTFRASTVWMAKNLWTEWLYARVPSLAFFKSYTMFSFPLATIIHLPTARLRVNSLNRILVRRGPAPRTIPREQELAILQDESGIVGIPEGDRKFNVLLIGSQGSGKTTDLLNIIKVDSRYHDSRGQQKAIVLIDIGKDTAKRALGIVPGDRRVIYLDPADPNCPWTVNPMLASVNEAVLADNVLEGLTEVFGDEAIRARSREFLGNSILAVRDVLGDKANFTDVYRLMTEEEFRNRIIRGVRDPHQKQYWQITFTNMAANNPRFIEEGLAAPRNKLDEVLRNPLIRAALESSEGRRQIDMREVVQGRAVLIANLDKSKLGKSGARLLGIMLITMLWHALQAQTDISEADRVPVSLVLDEAQNFISEGFLDILAEGRAFGAQTTVAVRFLGEIASEKVIKGLQALAQNLIVHQFELVEEAEVFMKRFMRVYANMVQVNAESQDALNFGADDFIRLPKFQAVCRFMVNGSPQQAFLAQTIPWEQAFRKEWAEAHKTQQPPRKLALPAEPPVVAAASASGVDDDLPPDLEPDDQPETAAPESPRPRTTHGTLPEALSGSSDILDLLLGEEAAAKLLETARDPLTGLLNRTVWDRVLARTKTDGHAVAFIDMDGLHEINEREGHDAGDLLISRCGHTIGDMVRAGDVAARYGSGDEFVALLADMDKSGAEAWTERLREAFAKAKIGVSVGVALQEPGESIEATLKRADELMYRDKEKRKAGRRRGTPITPHSQQALKNAGIASEDPAQWPPNDPRAVFCERYKMRPDRLLAMAKQTGVSDADLRSATNWALNNRIAGETVRQRLLRVLELKAEDKLLVPLANKLNMVLRDLREALNAMDVTPAEASQALKDHPDLQTLDDLRSVTVQPQGMERSR